MTTKRIQFSDFSDEDLFDLCQAIDVIACECPGYLARCLRQVRGFKNYTAECAEQFPENAATHQWLLEQASQAESLLWETMIGLMQRENLIDNSGAIELDKLSERARSIALKQIGGTH